MSASNIIQFCRICQNQHYDIHKGVLCGLTGKEPDFEDRCVFFLPVEEAEEEINSETEVVDLNIAGKGLRLANYLLDLLFLWLFSYYFFLVLGGILYAIFPGADFIIDEENMIVVYAFSFLSTMTYYSLFEYTTGRSIGKFITRTKVVTINGEKPDFKRIFIRTLCRHIPFEAFSFLGSDDSGWHDKISGTRVVKV